MEYKKEDIAFAYSLLNERDSLDQQEVEAWMKDGRNLRLLNEMERVRQQLAEEEGMSEQERLEKALYEQQSRKMTLRWALGVAIVLAIVLLISRLLKIY